MDKYILLLDDLEYIIDQLLYKSDNKVVDDFIRKTQIAQIINNLKDGLMEFVPYDQFKDIELSFEDEFSKTFKATWINGPILNWDDKKLNFIRRGYMKVELKKLNNSENITSKELNEVQFHIT